jgi:hypothetical protein
MASALTDKRSRRAGRMVYADYQTTSSVSTMLNQLHWTTLQERRAQAKACMMYPVVNQLIDIPSQILVPTRYDNVTLSPLASSTTTLSLNHLQFSDVKTALHIFLLLLYCVICE